MNNALILIKGVGLSTNNFSACSSVKFLPKSRLIHAQPQEHVLWWHPTGLLILSWTVLMYLTGCVCLYRCGVSLPGTQRSVRPLVCWRPAGLPGSVSSDGHSSPAVGCILWRLCQLRCRLVGRSDSSVRRIFSIFLCMWLLYCSLVTLLCYPRGHLSPGSPPPPFLFIWS